MQTVEVPNSPMQTQRLRTLAATGGAAAHCYTIGLELRGPLDAAAVQDGLDWLARCHPALRAEFDLDADCHVVRPTVQIPLYRHQVDARTGDTRWAAAMARAHADAVRPFDIDRAPLMRATLIAVERRRHLLVLSFDHLVMDAWSSTLVIRDLVAAADAASRGEPEPAGEFTDYVAVRRATAARVTAPDTQRAVTEHWAQLSHFRDRLPLAGNRYGSSPSGPTSTAGSTVSRIVMVDGRVVRGIDERAKALRAGRFATALTALTLTVAPRLTGPTLLYSTFACRETVVEENTVGWLSNRVPLPLPGVDRSVARFAGDLRRVLVDALRTQKLPPPDVDAAAARTGAGLTVSVQFLPAALIGTGPRSLPRIGAATVHQHTISMCPSGADVDLYVLDQPAMVEPPHLPGLALSATSYPDLLDGTGLDSLLDDWTTAMATLADIDWDHVSMSDASGLMVGGGSHVPS